MNRAEHLAWAKERALEYVEVGDLGQAVTSMISDLGKHDELRAAANDRVIEGTRLLYERAPASRIAKWIEGFR